MCIKGTEWPTATVLAVAHGSGQKIVLPPVRSGYSEELCSSLIMWWGKKLFLAHPSEEFGGTCCGYRDQQGDY